VRRRHLWQATHRSRGCVRGRCWLWLDTGSSLLCSQDGAEIDVARTDVLQVNLWGNEWICTSWGSTCGDIRLVEFSQIGLEQKLNCFDEWVTALVWMNRPTDQVWRIPGCRVPPLSLVREDRKPLPEW